MIARILFALAATASIPAILGPQPAHAAIVAPADRIQMEHISVEVIGKGSPVILIPGLSSPRAVWDGVAPELAKTHSVYLVQVNGFAGDDPRANLKPGVLDGIVADLTTLIAQQKLKAPAVVGHSMGGLVGLMLAARQPASVGRLMVVDALPWFAVLMAPPGTEMTMAMVEPRAAQMRDAVTASYGKPPSKAAAEANVASLTLKPESRAKATEWAMAADPRVTALALYEDLTTDVRGELKAVRAPTTIVYAWNSQYPAKDRADAFFRGQYAAIPNVTFAGIGESAHFVMLDQPGQFATTLNAFLAG
ncbi:pimeloyl-ACP methyl ester carboxylesterase [Sphingomonas naasensis]|uniref:Alpha/beta hydrolase n=1 Tax=Sphingomonas naasensis TaxID=1344951 RepID=A0A4S1WCP7_9SPHN|nr:alpha/beta hydrolase [Sphingomonas naasensis]NIJ22263.1 pimeloyl-ACP methyl ester carboxylesterase [Sphingomonas naasensis]TGX40724.1 alpha/beta hydrolase [Sphingomonas naasensis]